MDVGRVIDDPRQKDAHTEEHLCRKRRKTDMEQNKYVDKLLKLTKSATSQFHTVLETKKQLEEAGFEEVALRENWDLKRGGKYFMVHHDSTIFAFTIGEEFEGEDGFRLAACHGDFPGFRIKPNPEIVTEGYVQLNTEVYGGVNLASWLDRPLSIAGRVVLRSEDVFHPEVRLVDFKRPLLTIPNIAIHLQKEMNQGVELNRQTQMIPLLGKLAEGEKKEGYFANLLAEEMGVKAEDILEYELNVYNFEEGCLTGAKEEFITAPRLDNLTSVQALATAIIDADRTKGINCAIVYDHEEIGSRSKQGAQSTLIVTILKKIYAALGYSETVFSNAIMDSLLISADVSHAIHPSYAAKNDPTNKAKLNEGFCIKEACSQGYATDSEAIAIVQQICEKEGIAYQKFVNRSDGSAGGTLGSIVSAILPVRTVDMGIPMFAMHSSREFMGREDQESLVKFMTAYFSL